MAFGPITSWQTDEETMETVTDLIFLGSKITTDSDCSHEIIRCLFLGRKAMANLDSVLKSRDITLPTKVFTVIMVFLVIIYGCESWSSRRLSTEELMLSNFGAREDSWESCGQQEDQTSQFYRKSTLNIHWKDWCWSWSSSTFPNWCEKPTHRKRPWSWGKTEGKKRRGW